MTRPPRARPAEAALATAAFLVTTDGVDEVVDPPAAVDSEVLEAIAVVLKRVVVVLLLYGVGTDATTLLEVTVELEAEVVYGAATEVVTPETVLE